MAACETHFLATRFCCSKNPANKGQGPPNVPSAGPDPDYSDDQREEFGGRAWIAVEDRSLLDVAGTELLLVGAKDKPIETGESTVPQQYCSMLCWLHERLLVDVCPEGLQQVVTTNLYGNVSGGWNALCVLSTTKN